MGEERHGLTAEFWITGPEFQGASTCVKSLPLVTVSQPRQPGGTF